MYAAVAYLAFQTVQSPGMFSLDFCLKKFKLGPSPMHDKSRPKHSIQQVSAKTFNPPAKKPG